MLVASSNSGIHTLELKVLHESLLLRGGDTSFPHLDRTPLTV